MVTEDDIAARSTRMRQALKATFGTGGRSLAGAVKRAGRLLPSHVRADARLVIEAEALGGNPKLLRQVDATALAAAERRFFDFIDSIDVADRRKGKILGVLGAIAFNLLLTVALILAWVHWRGL